MYNIKNVTKKTVYSVLTPFDLYLVIIKHFPHYLEHKRKSYVNINHPHLMIHTHNKI